MIDRFLIVPVTICYHIHISRTISILTQMIDDEVHALRSWVRFRPKLFPLWRYEVVRYRSHATRTVSLNGKSPPGLGTRESPISINAEWAVTLC